MTVFDTIKTMIRNKIKFLKNLAFILVGVALGTGSVTVLILSLAGAIVLDFLVTALSRSPVRADQLQAAAPSVHQPEYVHAKKSRSGSNPWKQ